jgi:microcystin-dependent protein
MARNYSSVVEPKTLTANITDASATQITLNNVTGLPSAPYVLVINPDTAKEEVVLVTVDQTGVTSPTLKVQRAIEASGGAGVARNDHTIGDVVKHMIVGSDLQIVHDHFSNDSTTSGTAHGATGGVVGRTNSQTLTNKTINLTDNTLTGTTAQFNAALSDSNFAVTADITTINTALTTNTPVGSITMWATATPPTGWLLCNGQSTASYTALAAVVGATVPDMQGLVPVGFKTSDDAFGTLKGTGGSKISTAPHTHVTDIDHGHSASGSTSIANDGTHTHQTNIEIAGSLTNGGIYLLESNTTPRGNYMQSAGDHSHTATTSVTVSATGLNNKTSGASSASAANGNLQPYFTLNFIIKH